MESEITIITPTFNRAYTLRKLYESLISQSNQSFQWLIVDDGSVDSTKSLVDEFIQEDQIGITYMYQNNQGKHIALNAGIREISSELTFIVDSDDYLTAEAIGTILHHWNLAKSDEICGISYLRGYDENKYIGDRFPDDYLIDSFINVRMNRGIRGDKAEVWRTDLLKSTPFPQFHNEKFMGEAYVWMKLSKSYPMLFINKIIYICEYLADGLTKSGRRLNIQSPLGGMVHSSEALSYEFNMKVRIKNAWLYTCYGFFAEKSVLEIIAGSRYKLFIVCNLPFGFLLYVYWKIKYR